uniref:Glycylpeptide N-tetradecanoyltransferase n=1 Tax=Globodera rostochiensis TaxID=31243 RepID=A0A914GUG8_GLORO
MTPDDDKESEEQKKDDKESEEQNQKDAGKQQFATISAKKGKSKQKEVTNDAQPAQLNADMAADFARKIQIIQAASTSSSAAKDPIEAKHHKYQFWETQPVPQFNTKITENNYIDPPLDVSKVRKESYSLPEPFVWSDIDLNTNEQLDELYTLLTENYVEDDENMFRFDYGKNFLKWALMPHGWRHQWHCGVRAGTSAKLLAFIAAVPATIRIYDQTIRVVEINFLCVHKKLRSKRLAPVLIKEVTRRVNLLGVFQATFTAGIIIPKPVCTCRYWHRSLNPKKLIEANFSHLGKNMTLHRTIKLYKLPENTESHLTPLNKDFVQGAFKLLSEYLSKFDLAPVFTVEEFEHFFLPRDDVIYTYVVEDSGTVTDLISFYSLPSTIMHHTHHKSIKAAYSFYNVAGSVPLIRLMNDALILARNLGFDVFNALDLMDNKGILEDLKFGIGDGNLQYYLYNWKCPDIAPDRIGLVLQ